MAAGEARLLADAGELSYDVYREINKRHMALRDEERFLRLAMREAGIPV
jgi:hypothetical protein